MENRTMKTKIFSLALVALSLNACNEKDDNGINPANSALTACVDGARLAAITTQNYLTKQDGAWNDPNTWKDGIVPTAVNGVIEGTLNIDNIITYDGSVSGATFEFSGGTNINSQGGLTFVNTPSVTFRDGNLNINTYLETKAGTFTFKNGNINVNQHALLKAPGDIIFDNADGGINGTLHTGSDWNLINESIVIVNSNSKVFVTDDLNLTHSNINNNLTANCNQSDFWVGDNIFLHDAIKFQGKPTGIVGNGSLVLGGGSANGDGNVSAPYTQLFQNVWGAPGTYFSQVDHEATQITSSHKHPDYPNANPKILAPIYLWVKADPSFDKVYSCKKDPLPVVIVSFEAKYDGMTGVDVTWETSLEINNKEFRVVRVMACETFPKDGVVTDANRIEVVPANASHKYSVHYEVKNFGPHYFKLEQYDFDNTKSSSVWKSATVSGK
jgi:hypothetical protein